MRGDESAQVPRLPCGRILVPKGTREWSIGKDGSGTIRYEWMSGGGEVVIRCFVNFVRQMAVAYYIHAKGDGIHCELSPTKGE